MIQCRYTCFGESNNRAIAGNTSTRMKEKTHATQTLIDKNEIKHSKFDLVQAGEKKYSNLRIRRCKGSMVSPIGAIE